MPESDKEIVSSWMWITSITLLILAAVYIALHLFIPGAEVIKLSKQEVSDINLILFSSYEGDTNQLLVANGTVASDSAKKEAAYNYIFSVREPFCENARKEFSDIFREFDAQEFSVILLNYPIKVRSYFWLTEGSFFGLNPKQEKTTGPCKKNAGSVYAEIIFWAWFGLLASLLYNVSEALRTRLFNERESVVHIAKFFYAPLCALVIYFSIRLLISEGDIAVLEFSLGTIVLSFILGFFSGRAVELLNRIKDLILPLNYGRPEGNAGRQQAASGASPPAPAGPYTLKCLLELPEELTRLSPTEQEKIIKEAKIDIRLVSPPADFEATLTNPTENRVFNIALLAKGTYNLQATLQHGGLAYQSREISVPVPDKLEIAIPFE